MRKKESTFNDALVIMINILTSAVAETNDIVLSPVLPELLFVLEEKIRLLRNNAIVAEAKKGAPKSEIARRYRLTPARISQIITKYKQETTEHVHGTI